MESIDRMAWRGNITGDERILGALPYLLVLYSSSLFSDSIFRVFPQIKIILLPFIQPVERVYGVVPLAGLIIFVCLFLFVVRNERVKHFIRFNTLQALLLTFIASVISLILDLLDPVGFLPVLLDNFVFLAILLLFIFSVVQTVRGLYPELPSISEAVYMQVR